MDSAQHPASTGVPNTPGVNALGRNGAEPPLSATDFLTTRGSVPGTPRPRQGAPLWLIRAWVVIRVAFFIELGMVLVVLPWTRSWTENSLLASYPSIRSFLQNNFVCGVISGLGFLDIGLGIWEAVRYASGARDTTKKILPRSSR
jgi:hypothetical protein